MHSISNLLDALFWFLSLPEVKALSVLISVASLWMSIRTIRRLRDFTELNRKHLAVEQARFIDDQWQKSNHLILSNEKYLSLTAEMQGYKDEHEALRTYLLFNLINPLHSGFHSAKQGIMDKSIFEVGLHDMMSHFTGDKAWLITTLRERGYSDEFVDLCEAALTKTVQRSDAPRLAPAAATSAS